MSDETAQSIDSEIRSFIDRNYDRAENILGENIEILHIMAEALIKYETIDSDQIEEIMNGKPPTPPQDWTDEDSPEDGGGDGTAIEEEVVSDEEVVNADPASSH